MRNVANFICVDWGTRRLHATLCEYADSDVVVRHQLSGPGVVIAADIMGALDLRGPLPATIALIGEPALCAH